MRNCSLDTIHEFASRFSSPGSDEAVAPYLHRVACKLLQPTCAARKLLGKAPASAGRQTKLRRIDCSYPFATNPA